MIKIFIKSSVYISKVTLLICLVVSCNQKKKSETFKQEAIIKTQISNVAKKVRDYVMKNAVIAHRGSTYWTPEETEPAYRWARNVGVDYLELDIQLTKDNVLVAFHDDKLVRTTNVSELFPERVESEISDFTLKELRSLDAGSWFNIAFPNRARPAYEGLKIMTLKDVVMIAEGNQITKKNGIPFKEIIDNNWTGNYLYEKDPKDNGNRPGIYIETKNPKSGVDELLAKEIQKYGWNINNNPKTIPTEEGKVSVANSKGRLILQSFSFKSIQKLEQYLPNIPKCLLLGESKMEDDVEKNYKKAIQFAIENNVHIIGASISGAPNNYKELTAPWMAKLAHDAGMLIHPYSFDTNEQFNEYKDRIEGVFTNRADLALAFYGRGSTKSSEEILKNLRY